MTGTGGNLVGGRYRLTAVVGQGGMGRVWRGWDEVLGRQVAVKEVLPAPELSAEERSQLIRRTKVEAQAAARLRHAGIITVHDVVEQDGVPWIVMAYVDGPSLGALIARQERLGWEQVAVIGAQMAQSLAHAHSVGVVHRDLKPDNVLMDGEQAVLTDFGIARILDTASTLTATHTVVGTPQFMPPEQLNGQAVGASADLWSLGATLFTAVEGHPPFTGQTLMEILTAVLVKPVPTAAHAGPLADVLAALLVREPGMRPDAAETARRLLALIAVPSPAPSPALRATPIRTVPDLPMSAGPSRPEAAPGLSAAPTESAAAPAAAPAPSSGRVTGMRRRTLILGGAGAGVLAAAGIGAALSQMGARPARRSDIHGALLAASLATPDTYINVYAVAFSPDGKTLAAGGDGSLRLWDVGAKSSIATLGGDTVKSVAFSPDGKTLASSLDNGVRLWDVASKSSVADLQGHTSYVHGVAFSPDGKTFASGSEDRTVRLWDVASKSSIATLDGHTSGVSAVAFSPDGKTLAAGCDGNVRLWDVASRRSVATLDTHVSSVSAVAFSSDGKTLAAGCGDYDVYLWDAAAKSSVATLRGTGGVYGVAFSPDGKTLVSGGDYHSVGLWDVASGSSIATLDGHTETVWSVAFSPDGKTFACGGHDGSVRLWNLV
ncbi:tRNA A-37 threonylcarbamoyl transferase component Bud32/uncharacterized protein with WD repeat [Kitasatospora sp. GAS204A]|uniref:WD40 repeat domain-containing serine/threonine protein kinase n=1 Tax=unclassified Kitasatospora TaxID=2633591 RepID=UPI0024758AC3|nr:serine/threonine-protein kinase [Kitasatospora sp. GAS204B]MDH6123064.1 tRNA A-37 threonylcarbamoyl transferase component Bud32/uncharacterized protein with WD repeat [Kitasatospora sp. GAS204B]